ncbi:hypothetical protein RvY_06987 [Ramazzottius varieornatus]|uniref:Uncharacterized protein n=1 Tax=Ramazzottius varieornatus TaxID=947166 RepID=A0A1D1V6T4_RAMVA|nr:hypothetical protein RvY_06987 [Ramazzottius varieornatus]
MSFSLLSPNNFPQNSIPEPISQSEISRALEKVLVPGKANGPSLLSTELLLRCGSSLVNPLVRLFNSCFLRSIFPRSWKVSYVTAIPKGSIDTTRCTNWRPISLFHPFSKVFEAIMADRLRSYLESNHLLSDDQFGFRQKRSAELVSTLVVQQLLLIHYYFSRAPWCLICFSESFFRLPAWTSASDSGGRIELRSSHSDQRSTSRLHSGSHSLPLPRQLRLHVSRSSSFAEAVC